jgi:hypothetical protein
MFANDVVDTVVVDVGDVRVAGSMVFADVAVVRSNVVVSV